MEVLIDRSGRSWRPSDIEVADPVWEGGFIHIRTIGRSVIVSLSPRLATGVAMAAAFYEIADLAPECTCIVTKQADRVDAVFRGCAAAFRRIWELVAAEGNIKADKSQASSGLLWSHRCPRHRHSKSLELSRRV